VPQNRLTGLPDSQTSWILIHPHASLPISILITYEAVEKQPGLALLHGN